MNFELEHELQRRKLWCDTYTAAMANPIANMNCEEEADYALRCFDRSWKVIPKNSFGIKNDTLAKLTVEERRLISSIVTSSVEQYLKMKI